MRLCLLATTACYRDSFTFPMYVHSVIYLFLVVQPRLDNDVELFNHCYQNVSLTSRSGLLLISVTAFTRFNCNLPLCGHISLVSSYHAVSPGDTNIYKPLWTLPAVEMCLPHKDQQTETVRGILKKTHFEIVYTEIIFQPSFGNFILGFCILLLVFYQG
jgi:hypothetical protein